MATYSGKILTRSPFFITASIATVIDTAELKVFIWSGDSASKPAVANYTITKNALTSTSTNIIFEISELVRDYYEHNRDAYTDVLSTFTDVLWVEIDLTITPVTGSDTTVNNIYAALDGYGMFDDSVNPQGTNIIANEINILTGQSKLLPIYANSDGIDKVDWLKNSVVIDTDDLTAAVASAFSYDKLQYLTNTSDVDQIKLYKSTVLQETITINVIDECKYTPKQVKFYDANGALQRIFMFKKSIESLSTDREEYNSIIGSVSSGSYTYNTKNHQFKSYNITGKKSITLNTGYINEVNNDVIEQLLLSELVWVDDKPANIKTSSLTYKTSVNDKLINYTLDFDYANNLINNIY